MCQTFKTAIFGAVTIKLLIVAILLMWLLPLY